jgi:hypothetical protein
MEKCIRIYRAESLQNYCYMEAGDDWNVITKCLQTGASFFRDSTEFWNRTLGCAAGVEQQSERATLHKRKLGKPMVLADTPNRRGPREEELN